MTQADELEFQRELELLRKDGLKDNPLRKEYETKVAELAVLAKKLLAQGVSEECAARTLHHKCRKLGVQYKHAAPPFLQEYIYYAMAKKYGDPLGLSFEDLCKKKSYAEIIASSSRPIADLDKRLTVEGFREWFKILKNRENKA